LVDQNDEEVGRRFEARADCSSLPLIVTRQPRDV
jgi:hypothetical protein